MDRLALAERAHYGAAEARYARAIERAERLANRTQSILDELLCDPSEVVSAICDRDRAGELLCTMLEILPRIQDERSAGVSELLTFCKGIEHEVTSVLLFVARKRAEGENE